MDKVNKIKNWVSKNAVELTIGGFAILAAGIIAVRYGKEEAPKEEQLMIEEPKEIDFGRDLAMEFRTKDGELLGRIGCTESYMDDMLTEYDEDFRDKVEEA